MHSEQQTIAVMMPKIARKILGLTEGSFSCMAIDGGKLVFHGEGEDGIIAFPLSMMGIFHSDILNNLFQYLSNNRQNGILAVTTGPLTKVVFFKQGHIVFSGTTDVREQIGAMFVRLGYATQEQVDEIAAQTDRRRFGVRMRSAGYITHEQLWDALHRQVIRICCSLVSFPVGTYFFLPGCVPADAFTQIEMPAVEVLFQSVLRLDERERDRAMEQTIDHSSSPLGILSHISDD